MTKTDLLANLLAKKEWMFFETKRILKEPSKLLETVVAFANTEWGALVLGVEDPDKAQWEARLMGISENPTHYAEFLRLLHINIRPVITGLQKVEIPFNNKWKEDKIVAIFVDKSNEIHSLVTGDTRIRTENWNKKIWSEEIIRLKYEKWSLKFEDEITKIDSLEDFDLEMRGKFKSSLDIKETNDWQILKDNGLAHKKDNKRYLKQSWALLFAKNPSITLWWKYGIKVSHYFGTKENFSWEPNFVKRPFTIEWPLFSQIEKAISYFKEIVRNAPPKLKWAGFSSSILIPDRVFQEVITNAIIHRNYAIQNDIQVRIFDDRVEVESPWAYPWHITPANIQHERFSRNPVIVRTLNRFDSAPNLDIWEWVNRIFKIMKQHNLYEPYYVPNSIKRHSVLVVLFNMQKIEYRDSINNYLKKNITITNQKAREITWINDTLKMTRYLKSWVEKWLLLSTGEKRHTTYRKPGNEWEWLLFSDPLKIENKTHEKEL